MVYIFILCLSFFSCVESKVFYPLSIAEANEEIIFLWRESWWLDFFEISFLVTLLSDNIILYFFPLLLECQTIASVNTSRKTDPIIHPPAAIPSVQWQPTSCQGITVGSCTEKLCFNHIVFCRRICFLLHWFQHSKYCCCSCCFHIWWWPTFRGIWPSLKDNNSRNKPCSTCS